MKREVSKIGIRIRQARQARGLTLQSLAEGLAQPVTRAALSSYECGRVIPRADMLMDLGRVLGLPPSFFLEEPPAGGATISWLASRAWSRLRKRERECIQARAELQSEGYLRLLDLFAPGCSEALPTLVPGEIPGEIPGEKTGEVAGEVAENLAGALRQHWGIGRGPLSGLVERCEDAGILILGWNENHDFEGLAGWLHQRHPLVVLNLEHGSDRLRFNLARELGYLMLDAAGLGLAGATDVDTKAVDAMAHRFAVSLLVPALDARRELGVRRTRVSVAELEHLEQKYGFSVRAWTRRSRELGIIGRQVYQGLQKHLRPQSPSKGFLVREGVGRRCSEKPERFRMLCWRALTERLLDLQWVQRFCPSALEDLPGGDSDLFADGFRDGPHGLQGLSQEQWSQRLQAEASEAAEDYGHDPEVQTFLAFDDEESRE